METRAKLIASVAATMATGFEASHQRTHGTAAVLRCKITAQYVSVVYYDPCVSYWNMNEEAEHDDKADLEVIMVRSVSYFSGGYLCSYTPSEC